MSALPTMSASRLPTGHFANGASPSSGTSTSRQALMSTPMGRTTATTTRRPGSRTSWGGLIQGVGLATSVSVVDRPITQHGLGGLKTGVRPSQRQVQDKSYFLGLLRTKVNEINQEMGAMGREAELLIKEENTSRLSGKRASGLALELKGLQQELGDYNTLFDKLSTNTDVEEVDRECRNLKQQNDRDVSVIEDLFAKRRNEEHSISLMEKEVEEEKTLANSLIANMGPELQNQYSSLKQQSASLQQQMETMQRTLDQLEAQKATFEKSITSYVKQEAVVLYEKLQDAEEKQNALLDEEANRGTPAREREKLLKQVKEDNQEITLMERHVQEMKDQINKTTNELQQLSENVDASQSERNHQYLELRKREKVMDQFFESYESIKETDTERNLSLERNIVSLLENISSELERSNETQTTFDLANFQYDLNFDEKQFESSSDAMTNLKREQRHLITHLKKVNQLESNAKQEISVLNDKIKKMAEDMSNFKQIDALKGSTSIKERELMEEYALLVSQSEDSKANLTSLLSEHEALKNKLVENEAFIQLGSLERKWQHLEQSNFALKEFVKSKTAETNCEPITKDVFKQLENYNRVLQAKMSAHN